MSFEGDPTYVTQDDLDELATNQQQTHDPQWALEQQQDAVVGGEVQEMADDTENQQDDKDQFYLRWYAGHQAKDFGHEFIEFELRGDGTLRYSNESQYKRDIRIRKEVKLSKPFFEWIRQRVIESDIINADDSDWPEENQIGRQELELRLGRIHLFVVTCKLGSKAEVIKHNAGPSLETFYNLSNDLKLWFLDIMSLHFRLSEL